MGYYWDRLAALLEACTGAVDALSLVGTSIADHLDAVLTWLVEVVRHVLPWGAALVLAATSL